MIVPQSRNLSETAMKRQRLTTRDIARDAERHRSDLNILYGVIALLESGTMSVDSYEDTQAIIRRCKSASQRCLARYDRAHAKLALKPQ